MSDSKNAQISKPWSGDPSFWTFTVTQFLGALNDNIFKQLVMLLCIDLAMGDPQKDKQFLAQVLFSAPFILFSGYAGYLADRYSKRSIVVLCKFAEILIAFLGMMAFGSGQLGMVLGVLALMGTHSAFFGPPKYGILPELFHERDLPKINGVVLMTTFLAVILAFPIAGFLKEYCESHLRGELWWASVACLVLAFLGSMTALAIRKTPVARPDLKFEAASIFIHPGTWKAIRQQPGLLVALLASSAFWLTGGVVYPMVINSVAKLQYGLSDVKTGYLAACTGIGITIGCVLAGVLSQNRFRAKLVRLGMWGMFLTLVVLAIPGSGFVERTIKANDVKGFASKTVEETPAPSIASSETPAPTETPVEGTEPAPVAAAPQEGVKNIVVRFRPMMVGLPATAILLVLLGISAGMFSVPVQVYLQAKAPAEQKGRIIGVMNLFNWIGIASAGPFYQFWLSGLKSFEAPNLLFAAATLGVLPLLLFYHPKDETLAK